MQHPKKKSTNKGGEPSNPSTQTQAGSTAQTQSPAQLQLQPGQAPVQAPVPNLNVQNASSDPNEILIASQSQP